MARRICIVAVANNCVPLVKSRLPVGIWIARSEECFERAVMKLRLEGPGLPGWCEEPPNGAIFATAELSLDDGGCYLNPVPPSEVGFAQLIVPPKESNWFDTLNEGGNHG